MSYRLVNEKTGANAGIAFSAAEAGERLGMSALDVTANIKRHGWASGNGLTATESPKPRFVGESKRTADRIDGYDRDDLGESPDF